MHRDRAARVVTGNRAAICPPGLHGEIYSLVVSGHGELEFFSTGSVMAVLHEVAPELPTR